MKLDFLIGCATSATQIEGGDKNNNWYRFSSQGKCSDKTCCHRANDHYNLYREDIDLMADMGIEIYRFGVEWSRIEPEKGIFSKEAIEHYRGKIKYMISKKIKPLLTLHHFTNPIWFEDSGGFSKRKNISFFLDYVKACVRSFGDLVNEYVTINEPNVYVGNSFLTGEWPPQKKNIFTGLAVFKNMAISHVETYKIIHNIRKEMGYSDTKVGFANHFRVFAARSKKDIIDNLFAKAAEYFFQKITSDVFMYGKIPFTKGYRKKSEYYDFVGINYYTRSAIKRFSNGYMEKSSYNDLGWEIYPKGIRMLTESLYAKYKKEIYITENGVCDKNDSLRSKFILEHLAAISYKGSPVTRYYHWSFMDNFEWAEGESACFGLVEVDYSTQKRTVRKSGQLYSELIKTKEINRELIDKYNLD